MDYDSQNVQQKRRQRKVAKKTPIRKEEFRESTTGIAIKTRKNRHGSNNSNWKGGRKFLLGGRVLLFVPEHPDASRRGYILRSRLVAGEHLGRRLLRSEVVHHINGNPTDDSIDNLKVITQNEHAALHIRERIGDKWALNFPSCKECKTTQRAHHANGYCTNCYPVMRRRVTEMEKAIQHYKDKLDE